MEQIDTAINILGYDRYNPIYTDNREEMITDFAQYLYIQNDTGVENVKFNLNYSRRYDLAFNLLPLSWTHS